MNYNRYDKSSCSITALGFLAKGFVIFLLLHVFTSCRPKTDQVARRNHTIQIHALEQSALKLSQTDPDSAEKVMLLLIDIFDSIGDHRGVIDYYSGLSELYQYSKHDDIASLQALTNAFLVSARHPEEKNDNPYLFINGGNLLYRNGLFGQAIDIYRGTCLAMGSGGFHPKVLAFNNIGLSFAALGQHDSALNYYKLAQQFIPDSIDLLQAQARILQSEALFKLERYREINPLLLQAGQVLDTYRSDSLKHKIVNPEHFNAMFYKFSAKKSALQARLQHYDQQPRQAMESFITATGMAKATGNMLFRGNLMLDMLQQTDILPDKLIPIYADSIEQIADSENDPVMKLKTARLLHTFYSHIHDDKHSAFWKQKAEDIQMHNDSIKRGESEFHENLIQSSSLLLLSLYNTRESRDNYRSITHRQTLLILLLSLLLLGSGLAFVLKEKLRKTKLKLAERTSEVTRLELGVKTPDAGGSERNSRLAYEFETLMEQQLLYTNKDISLSELATKLSTNHSYLSKAINTHYGMNFKEVLNQFRVKAACRLLMSDFTNKFTMESISGEVGFNSTSSFYSSFKKYTGVSPLEYRKLYLIKAIPDK